ncbi:MAG: hypothetical protein ABIT37_03275 [Luteolibacter sp.]
MEMISVRCNHCGAPLEVGGKTRFVTCQFCNSQLEIKHSESAVFTEEVTRIADNTEKMAGSLEAIRLQNEIEQLDREWGLQQETYDARGRTRGPQTTGQALFGMGFALFFAVVCFGMSSFASSVGGPGGIFSLVPVGMGIFALVGGVMGLVKSQGVQSSRGDYQQRRAALMRKLDALDRL